MKRLRYVDKISIMYKIKYRLKSVKIGVQNSYRYPTAQLEHSSNV